ncbi:MAG: UDP-glucose 4-epimerase GalE [Flavobacteriales bacterium]|nr:UDP-glucose 4-epimerase GalE [Flavobacteriales bacterium]
MKHVLVTGGAGYIGSHTVVELVQAGYEVVIVDDLSASDGSLLKGIKAIIGKDIPFIQVDVADVRALHRIAHEFGMPDAVIHFAAYKSVNESVAEPLKYYRNNIGGMAGVLQFMKEGGVKKIVFSSSCSVYGQPQLLPVNEEASLANPQSPYANTKKICEEMLADFCKANQQIDAISLRYFNPIGAHPSSLIGELPVGVPNNLVPYITQTAAGLREKLFIYGTDYNTPDGSCIRDFIHVSDLAIAHVKALEYQPPHSPEVFNIGTGEGVSVLQLVTLFEDVTGKQLPIEYTHRRPGDVEQVWADNSKALKKLGWKPQYTLQEALLSAWNWEKKIRGITE